MTDVKHDQRHVQHRPGQAAQAGGEALADVAHEAEFVELRAQREKNREPEEGDQRVALLGDVVERDHAHKSSKPNPMNATLVVLRCSLLPKIQPATISTKATAVIHSLRDIAPMPASSLRAAAGASGVAPTRGGKVFATSRGSIPIAMSDGTEEASSHFPKSIWTRPSRDLHGDRVGGGGRHPKRGGDREARHRAEHQIAAQAPALGIVGLRARPLATDSTIGKSTPPRAVLLGNAGAMAASVSTML